MTRWWPAHPRSRGENFDELDEDAAERGSSPLTRGKPQRRRGRQQGHWLIPAHAGKTKNLTGFTCFRWAHPRSRGENRLRLRRGCLLRGSSPLTRGKHWSTRRPTNEPRLIPAHAGKTSIMRRAASRQRAHPRSRGENSERGYDYDHENGSSPLTRGKHALPCSASAATGLIPAHAGKTN